MTKKEIELEYLKQNLLNHLSPLLNTKFEYEENITDNKSNISNVEVAQIDTTLFGRLIIPVSTGITNSYTVILNGNSITFILDIWDECLSKTALKSLRSSLDNIPKMYLLGVSEILNTYKTNDIIKRFIDFHLNELDDDALSCYFNVDVSSITAQMFMTKLDVISIWFTCADSINVVCNIDFGIEELSDDVLVVKFNSICDIIDISHES